MTEFQQNQIKKIVYTFSNLANVKDEKVCNELINRLCNMTEEDVIDYLIVSLNDLVDRKQIKVEDIFSNISLITSLSKKYSSQEDLIKRLNFLKSMNMIYTKMPLSENHKLLIEAFDKFNQIIGTNFDSYYTGGLMGYLATNHPLVRYHGDLDLLINEEQLESLYELIKQTDEFEFISNMSEKEEHGHEFKIQYNGTDMSIGLFLFERKPNNEIIIKEYYHVNNNKEEELLVNEQHLSPEYASMIFANDIKEHNGITYRMKSLESIYNSKKNSRPKDKYDASIIKDIIDLKIDHNLDTKKQNNYDVIGKNADNSIVAKMENKINCLKQHI